MVLEELADFTIALVFWPAVLLMSAAAVPPDDLYPPRGSKTVDPRIVELRRLHKAAYDSIEHALDVDATGECECVCVCVLCVSE